jgi:MoaA/NifB/PqqE/SkfB family radical SAM enzyme
MSGFLRNTLKGNYIRRLPIMVLMPHSSCNCRCVMCDIWKANRDKREISREELAKHREDFVKLKVKHVALSGGEALLHSHLWQLCEWLQELDIKISLLSTGLLLKKYNEQIVRWCDEVIVSLDGSPAVHDEIRNIPNAFAGLQEGVLALQQQDPELRITGRSVLQRLNYFDLPNIIDTAHTIGLQQISFLAVDVSSTAFNRPQPWAEQKVTETALDLRQIDEFAKTVEQTIESRKADFDSGFIAETPAKLRHLVEYFRAIHGFRPFPENRCNAPWVSTVIEADGDVRPCFFHPAFGNINAQRLSTILNSAEFVAFRKNLDIKTDPVCQKCVCTLNYRQNSLLKNIIRR